MIYALQLRKQALNSHHEAVTARTAARRLEAVGCGIVSGLIGFDTLEFQARHSLQGLPDANALQILEGWGTHRVFLEKTRQKLGVGHFN